MSDLKFGSWNGNLMFLMLDVGSGMLNFEFWMLNIGLWMFKLSFGVRELLLES